MRTHTNTLFVSALAIVLALACGNAHAVLNIGPGDVPNGMIDNNDTAADLILIDTASVNLPAGPYSADQFNYEFFTHNGTLGGTIQPLLVTGTSPNFTVIALGAPVTYTGDTGAFVSSDFAGTDTFSFASATDVYAGFYWDQTTGGTTNPIGYNDGVGNSFIRYSGANAPSVGNLVSGGSSGTFARTYDFSISVNAIPEPTSAVLSLIGLGALALRRRRQA